MKLKVFILFLFVMSTTLAQNKYQSVDEIMLSMPKKYTTSIHNINYFISQNFKTEEDKTRALFILITKNFSYDYNLKYHFSSTSVEFSDENKLIYILKNKKGVCDNFAILFHESAKKLGLKSVFISGIVKDYRGKIQAESHAWNAVRLQNKWYIIDATWGSNNQIKDSSLYLIPSSEATKQYYPSDYLWQFSDMPISAEQFINPKSISQNINVKFEELYANFEIQDSLEKEKSIIKRIENGGIQHPLINNEYEFHVILAQKYELDKLNFQIHKTYQDYSAYVRKFNANGSDLSKVKSLLLSMLTDVNNQLIIINKDLQEIKKAKTDFHNQSIFVSSKNISDLQTQIISEKKRLEKY